MGFTSQTILLVEDNEDDVFIFNRAVQQAKISNPIQVVTDGDDAMAYLGGTGRFEDRGAFPMPFLVFLDLKLPRVGGLEVLKWMREQASLDNISVAVLTSSAEERDVMRAYQLGARSYLVKPPPANSLMAIVNALGQSTAADRKGRLHIPGETGP